MYCSKEIDFARISICVGGCVGVCLNAMKNE